MNIEAAIEGKSSRDRFWMQVEWVVASFRCYDNSDVIATLSTTNLFLSVGTGAQYTSSRSNKLLRSQCISEDV